MKWGLEYSQRVIRTERSNSKEQEQQVGKSLVPKTVADPRNKTRGTTNRQLKLKHVGYTWRREDNCSIGSWLFEKDSQQTSAIARRRAGRENNPSPFLMSTFFFSAEAPGRRGVASTQEPLLRRTPRSPPGRPAPPALPPRRRMPSCRSPDCTPL